MTLKGAKKQGADAEEAIEGEGKNADGYFGYLLYGFLSDYFV